MKKLIIISFIIFINVSISFAKEAILFYFKGKVEIQKENSSFWINAKKKQILYINEKVKTGKFSRALILFKDGTRSRLGPDTIIEINRTNSPAAINQKKGRTRNKVSRKGRGFKVKTPTALCSVRGTNFEVNVTNSGDTLINVFEGVVRGTKLSTGESMDIRAGGSLKLDSLRTPLNRSGNQTPRKSSSFKSEVRKEVGLGMTKERIQAAFAQEIKLAEYQEGKSLIDVNGDRVRIEEYILRSPRDVAVADRDKAFKFVVLNTRQDRLDFFTYKGIFNKTLPTDLSIALNNVTGRQLGDEPEYYLTSYEMAQSNLTDAIKDMADGGHLVRITFDGTTYTLDAYNVAADGSAGSITDTATQIANSNGQVYDPIADVYRNTGTQPDAIYDPVTDTFSTMEQGDTLWRTVFNRYGHLVGDATVLDNLTLDNVPSGTLTQPWFQYYEQASGITNIATLESLNNAALTSSGNMESRGETFSIFIDQDIGNASYRYLNGNFAFDAYFPDAQVVDSPTLSDGIHQRLITYYPNGSSDIPFEQYDTYIFSNEGDVAPISAFSNATSGKAFKEELLKWNYEQIIQSSAFGSRKIDIVVEPKILIRSGLLD